MGTISYDLATACTMITGARLEWFLSGADPKLEVKAKNDDDIKAGSSFTFNNGYFRDIYILSINQRIVSFSGTKNIPFLRTLNAHSSIRQPS